MDVRDVCATYKFFGIRDVRPSLGNLSHTNARKGDAFAVSEPADNLDPKYIAACKGLPSTLEKTNNEPGMNPVDRIVIHYLIRQTVNPLSPDVFIFA